jgi:hypothetical protein
MQLEDLDIFLLEKQTGHTPEFIQATIDAYNRITLALPKLQEELKQAKDELTSLPLLEKRGELENLTAQVLASKQELRDLEQVKKTVTRETESKTKTLAKVTKTLTKELSRIADAKDDAQAALITERQAFLKEQKAKDLEFKAHREAVAKEQDARSKTLDQREADLEQKRKEISEESARVARMLHANLILQKKYEAPS